MELAEVLQARRDEIVDEAAQRLGRAHLTHYETAGPAESRRRLDDLMGKVTDAVRHRSLAKICGYASTVARERFEAGFDISEVQTAFNVLEETLWRLVIAEAGPENVAEAAGLIDTVLGAAKDTIARTWVSLASQDHVQSLDLRALFEGAAS
jgi:hypothetical protein